jgi:hypothetical protein
MSKFIKLVVQWNVGDKVCEHTASNRKEAMDVAIKCAEMGNTNVIIKVINTR